MAIFVPEIFSNAVNEELGVHLRLGKLAFDATDSVGEIKNAGETVVFPSLDRVVKIEEITKGDKVTPNTISMSKMEAKIKMTAGAARVYDIEQIQIKGAVKNEMVRQVAEAMALDIEQDLGKSILNDALYKMAIGNDLTPTFIETGFSMFGDSVNTDSYAGLVINSAYNSSFYTMDEFTSADKTYATIGNGVVVNNVIGFYRGIPVVCSDAATYDENDDPCIFMLKKRALGYIFQRAVKIAEEREEKEFCTDIIVSSLYATKLLNPKGVVVLQKTVS